MPTPPPDLMVFLLSKLLPLLVMPLGLSLVLLAVAWFRRRRWPLPLAFGLLWLFSLPVVEQGLWRVLEHPWRRLPARQAPSAGAIVVLSGGFRHPSEGPVGTLEWRDPDRFQAGLELFRARRAPRLVFTGGPVFLGATNRSDLPSEGELYRRDALARGLPPRALTVTGRVLNTAEEARALAVLLPRGSSVLLVTSAFHMPRARRLLERQGLRVLPWPVDFQARGSWAGDRLRDPWAYLPDAEALEGSSRALRESLGRLLYRSW